MSTNYFYRLMRPTVCYTVLLLSLGSIPLWGAEPKYLDGHAEPVREIGITRDGKWLVSVGDDSRVIVRPTEDLTRSSVTQPRAGGLRCLAFSRDGQHVYAAGNLADFGRKTEIDGAIRVSLRDGKTDGFVEFPVRGTIQRMALVDDTQIVYLCASHELLSLDIGTKSLSKKARIYGGFAGTTAISPEGHHFAVTSQNERNRQSAEPCRLTVLTADGKETLSYQFANQKEYRGAVVTFPTHDQLVLCLPTGKLLRWTWSKEKTWRTEDKPLTTATGPFSSIASSKEGALLWLARDRTLIAIDSKTGTAGQQTDLQIGERSGKSLAAPIGCMAILEKSSLAVVGLQDGRLALVPITKTGN
jgi:WD40 repeat protein